MKFSKMLLSLAIISFSGLASAQSEGNGSLQRVQLSASLLNEKGEAFCNSLWSFRVSGRPELCKAVLKIENRIILELMNKGPGYDILRAEYIDASEKLCSSLIYNFATAKAKGCWNVALSKVSSFDDLAKSEISTVDLHLKDLEEKKSAYCRALHSESCVSLQNSFLQVITELAKVN
ncbi:hypothetical protein [Bdellovibrio sp. KM01]|uniref:hypothetical protein n=1 Tax=Bdellovibrio sp. KM01 TaxID=2748865 RepID=UPI0015EB06F7|nr:hypothetical protein [Bdellovibrio sp. KM01]QLY24628.1 hypothetical protein HW988_14380 [Bdellovibrio sp. KM01]